MSKFRNFLYPAISIPVFIILVWFFAIPDKLIKTAVEDSISKSTNQNISASIEKLRKGLFFTVYADSLELKIEKTSALKITNISGQINPLYLLRKKLAFSVKGRIGTGNIDGFFKLPEGVLKIENVELDAIPYLASTGLKAEGLISAELNLKNNNIDIAFKIPDADLSGSVKGIAFPISSFRKIHGALSLKDNTIKIKSISLEADKGYARLRGDVTNGFMNLVLELMPSAGKLDSLESTLISRYRISPGYYVIPIEGPLL